MEIDFELLRQDLLDYLGTAWTGGNPLAMAELSAVETATCEELLAIARRLGFIQED